MASDNLLSITYQCSKPSCGHTQVITYFPDDAPLPTTCCVKCRAGFGVDLSEMMNRRIGMFPVGSAA
jgi:hypothetical protein